MPKRKTNKKGGNILNLVSLRGLFDQKFSFCREKWRKTFEELNLGNQLKYEHLILPQFIKMEEEIELKRKKNICRNLLKHER